MTNGHSGVRGQLVQIGLNGVYTSSTSTAAELSRLEETNASYRRMDAQSREQLAAATNRADSSSLLEAKVTEDERCILWNVRWSRWGPGPTRAVMI